MVDNARTGLITLWNGLNLRQRTLVVGSAALLLISLIAAMVMLAGDSDYIRLYGGLDGSEAAAITKKLSEKMIKVKLADNGGTILVPSREVDAARLALAADNLLPKGGSGSVGLEIFDKTKIGSTEFERRVNYVRALQGELERTFRQMGGVDAARVMIVLPEQSLFVQQVKPTTASVWLKLKAGVRLDEGQVKGIVRLVSHSVENLKPENVTVVDVNGRILSSRIDSGVVDAGGTTASSGRLDATRKFQSDLEKSLQGLLEQVLGPSNVAARVTAELNFDQRVTESTLFKPQANGQGILRSVEELSKTFKGTAGSGGRVGTDSNTPGGSGGGANPSVPQYPSQSGGGSTESEETSRRANYEIDSIKERIVVAPGAVKRLSVAVVVNKDLKPEQVTAVEKMVAATIGLDPKRDDLINVTGLKFDRAAADEMKTALETETKARQTTTRYLYLGAVVLALVVLLALMGLTRGARRVSGEVMMAGHGQMGGFPMHLAEIKSEPEEPARELTPEEKVRQKREKEIYKLAGEKPEDVANLIKSWLSEDK